MTDMVKNCLSCRTELVGPEGNVGDFKRATGASTLCNVKDGLTLEYVCAPCVEKMRPHLEALLAMLPPEKVRYLHWPNLVAIVRPER